MVGSNPSVAFMTALCLWEAYFCPSRWCGTLVFKVK
ncbi:unnamed protein product [Brassica oleracea]